MRAHSAVFHTFIYHYLLRSGKKHNSSLLNMVESVSISKLQFKTVFEQILPLTTNFLIYLICFIWCRLSIFWNPIRIKWAYRYDHKILLITHRSYSSDSSAAVSFRPDFRISTTADMKHWHHVCCACCTSEFLTRHVCPWKIQTGKSTTGIQSDIFNHWPWSQNIKAARQQREYKTSLRARAACAASVQQLPHHRNSPFLTFPLKSEEYTTAVEILTCLS